MASGCELERASTVFFVPSSNMTICSPRGLLVLALVLSCGCGDCEEQGSIAAPPSEPVEVTERRAWRALDPPAEPGALGMSLAASSVGVIGTWLEPTIEGHRQRFAILEGDVWSAPVTVVEANDMIANWADFPRAVRGGDGAIYVHHLKRAGEAPYAYEIRLARTRDRGETFEQLGVVHRDGTPTEHGFVSMVPTTDGVRLFWLDARATVDEGGATVVYTATVATEIGAATRVDSRACDCCQTDAATVDGGVAVVFRDRLEGEVRDIAIALLEGDTPTASALVHRDGWQIAGCPVNGPAIAARGARVAVAWFTGAEGGAVRVAWSEDGGASFAAPVDVDARQPPGRVDIALTDDGAAVSWLARSSEGGAEVRVRHVDVGGGLSAPTVVASTGTERASGFPVMARDGERLLVAHRDDAEPSRVHVSALPLSELPREPSDEPEPAFEVPLSVGDPLPDVHVRRESEELIALSAAAEGKALLIAFYASWCQPCRDEVAAIEAVRRSYLREGLMVVAVSVDEGSLARAEAVARRWGYEGTVLRDADAAGALGVPPLPGLFLFDAEHTLRFAAVGRPAVEEEIAAAVVQLND